MVTVAVICPACRRVVALGATLPAVCLAGIGLEERATLTAAALDAHPKAHRECVELEVEVPDQLDGEASLAEVERAYARQLAALGELVSPTQP
jgi:hypothetical protein